MFPRVEEVASDEAALPRVSHNSDLDGALNGLRCTPYEDRVGRVFPRKANRVHVLAREVVGRLRTLRRESTSRIKSFAYNPGRNLSVVYKLLF